jgi:hypothetical protein
MSNRPRFAFVLIALAAVAAGPAAAQTETTIRASGFESDGLSMGGWRWLANQDGDAHMAWTFSSPRLAGGDVRLHLDGLAAFPPGSPGTASVRLHYGAAAAARTGSGTTSPAPEGELSLNLATQPGETAVVGVPVVGEAVLTAAMLNAAAPSATKLVVRMEQSENPGVSLAFRRRDMVLTVGAGSGEAGMGAGAFESNGDLINGWYWLRDQALDHFASWRLADVTVPASGLPLSIEALATNRVSGPPGIAARFVLRYGTSPSVLEGRGGQTMAVNLTNVSPPGDPVGYTNRGTVTLPARNLGGGGHAATVYLRVERAAASGPHVAFRAASMSIAATGGETAGGTTEGGGTTGGGTTGGGTTGGGGTGGGTTGGGTTGGGTTGGGTTGGTGTGGETASAVSLTVEDGGRKLISSVPFLVAADAVGTASDPDDDGVDQAVEDAMLQRLNPQIGLDEEEDWLQARPIDKVVQFGRVTPYPNRQVGRYLLVYYATTWSRDYGRFAIGLDVYDREVAQRHNGDVELVVEAWEILDPKTAALRWVFTSAHGAETLHSGVWAAEGSSCNDGKVAYGPDQRICATLSFSGGRLSLQASEDKHAFYPTVAACEAVRLAINLGTGIGEDCGGGGSFIFEVYNAGEPGLRLLDDIGGLFAGEKLWTGDASGQFCGGHEGSYNPDLPCPGRVGNRLGAPPDLLKAKLLGAPLSLQDGKARLYENIEFAPGSWIIDLTTSSAIDDLSRYGTSGFANDRISSIKMGRGIACTFYEHANHGGQHLGPLTYADAVNGEWPDLRALGWNDRISSIYCQPAP